MHGKFAAGIKRDTRSGVNKIYGNWEARRVRRNRIATTTCTGPSPPLGGRLHLHVAGALQV